MNSLTETILRLNNCSKELSKNYEILCESIYKEFGITIDDEIYSKFDDIEYYSSNEQYKLIKLSKT